MKRKLSSEKKKEILEQVKEFYRYGLEGNESMFRRAKKAILYKRGGAGQWPAEVLAEFRRKLRPAVVINEVEVKTEFLFGVFTENQKDLHVFNKKGGASRVAAKVLTSLIADSDDKCDAIYEEAEQFDDGLVAELGWMLVDRVHDKHEENGKIVSRRVNPLSVVRDPNGTNYDAEVDSRFIIIAEWIEKDKLDAEYPELKSELQKTTGWGEWTVNLGRSIYEWARGDKAGKEGDLSGLKKYKYPRVTCYWKEWKKAVKWSDRGDEGIKPSSRSLTWEEDIEKARMATQVMPDRFKLDDRPVRETLNKTIWVENVLLEHDDDPWKNNQETTLFNLIPYSPLGKDGYWKGIVDNMIGQGEGDGDESVVMGPQEMMNKSISLAMDHLAHSVSTATYYKDGTFYFDEDEVNFEEHGPEPGKVYKLRKDATAPEPGKPAELSSGLMEILNLGSSAMKTTTAINDQNLGYTSTRDMSGKAMEMQHVRGLTVNNKAFHRYDHTRRMRGRLLVDLILNTNVYPDEEIMSVVDPEVWDDAGLLEEAAEEVQRESAQLSAQMGQPAPMMPPRMPQMPTQAEIQGLQTADPERAAQELPMMQMEFDAAMQEYEQLAQVYEMAVKTKAQEIVLRLLRNPKAIGYNVKTAENRHTVTRREERRMKVKDLFEMMPQLANTIPEILVKSMDMEEEEDILEAIKKLKEGPQTDTNAA